MAAEADIHMGGRLDQWEGLGGFKWSVGVGLGVNWR